MTNKVDFRFSKPEFCAYLMLLGYTPTQIETQVKERYFNSVKVFFHFNGYKEEFLRIKDEFDKGNLQVNLKDYTDKLLEVKRTIREQVAIATISLK